MPPSKEEVPAARESLGAVKKEDTSDAVIARSEGLSRVLKWCLAVSILLNVVLAASLALIRRVNEPAPPPPTAVKPADTKQNIDKARSVSVGMSGAAVTALLGDPVVREFTDNSEEWHYCRTGENVDEYVAIAFSDQKVTGLQYYTVRWLDLAFHYPTESEKVVGKTGAGDCRLTVRWGTYGQRTPSYPGNASAGVRVVEPVAAAAKSK
jgi:hypothetical protein